MESIVEDLNNELDMFFPGQISWHNVQNSKNYENNIRCLQNTHHHRDTWLSGFLYIRQTGECATVRNTKSQGSEF